MKEIKTYRITLLTIHSCKEFDSEILCNSNEESAKKYGEYMLSLPRYREVCDKFKLELVSTIYYKETIHSEE